MSPLAYAAGFVDCLCDVGGLESGTTPLATERV